MLSTILTVLGIHILAVMSPGPDFIMAVKNSLEHGRKSGIMTAIGFGLGVIVHLTYCILGLGYLISKSIILFSIIKFAGATYLIYIGIKSILSKSESLIIDQSTGSSQQSQLKSLYQGFITNALNPKATIYFVSVFSILIKPDTNMTAIMIIGIAMIVFTILWFSLVALFFTTPKINQHISNFNEQSTRPLADYLSY